MRTLSTTMLLLLSAGFAVHANETTIENIGAELRLLEQSGTTKGCSARRETSQIQNSAQLFYSAAVCGYEKRNADSAFFLLAGQIRSTADMELYEPASVDDQGTVGALYGLILYHFGGPGDETIYRDPEQYAALILQLTAWVPTRSDSYNPGWRFKASPEKSLYEEVVALAKQKRLTQLAGYSELVRDEQYTKALKELQEIQKRSPRGVVSDTADVKRTEELLKEMQLREKELKGED